jgi:uroporphyrinogen-III synthase
VKPVIVIRPQPGCDATVTAARALGLDAQGFPLFETRPVAWRPPAPDAFDAVLIGSANALRHAGPALGAYAGKPAYAVGAATADAARHAGLDVVVAGSGGLQRVLAQVAPDHRQLLRLCGRERVALDPSPGTAIEERVVYASEPLPFPPDLEALLHRPAVVLLHSAEAAQRFAGLCDANHIARAGLALAALAPRVARAAGSGWAALRSAPSPGDAALLALAQEMCQEARGVILGDRRA